MGGILFRCYDCDYWLVRHQIVCPSCKRRYDSTQGKSESEWNCSGFCPHEHESWKEPKDEFEEMADDDWDEWSRYDCEKYEPDGTITMPDESGSGWISQLNPKQKEAFYKLYQNYSWKEVFEDLAEVDDAVEMLWYQLYQVATPMAQNPEITSPDTFIELIQAAGRLSGGLEALKSKFPYNQFELENEKQELTDFIDHLEKLYSGSS